jgi:hypothetical protein
MVPRCRCFPSRLVTTRWRCMYQACDTAVFCFCFQPFSIIITILHHLSHHLPSPQTITINLQLLPSIFPLIFPAPSLDPTFPSYLDHTHSPQVGNKACCSLSSPYSTFISHMPVLANTMGRLCSRYGHLPSPGDPWRWLPGKERWQVRSRALTAGRDRS